MKWTKKKPNKTGHYWYKSDSTQGLEVLRVREHKGGFFADNEEYHKALNYYRNESNFGKVL